MEPAPGFDKKEFLALLQGAYISRYINTNVHCHVEFFRVLKEISKLKKPAEILDRYEYIKKVLVHGDHYVPTEVLGVVGVDDGDIKRIVLGNVGDVASLSGLKGLLTEEVYALLCFVYNVLVRQKVQDIQRAMGCIAYMVGLKPKDVGSTGNVSIIDIIYNMVVHVAKVIGKDMHRYALVSREIMYFRSNKKVLGERLRLLYVTVYVVGGGCQLDIRKLVKPRRGATDTDYLYVICERDTKLSEDIQGAAEMLRRKRHTPKSVVVDMHAPEGIDIVKISR